MGSGPADNAMSRSYSRTMGAGERCEYFAEGLASIGGVNETREKFGSRHTTCDTCHYWLPFGTMPQVGQCDNPSSRHFERPTFYDKPTEEGYTTRSLDKVEFMWDQTHRQTIHSTDLPDHRVCRLYLSSVSLPVEEQVELTFAGD